jgi:gamma-glutamyltranspeptidase/glutathione hydrolase
MRSANGMVAASQPLAAAAGLKVMMDGGNAFDAAVAAAGVLGVVEPFMTGVGGDVFALAWDAKRQELVGLNGSGRSGRNADSEHLRRLGYRAMPKHGPHTVTVPGAVDAWCALVERYGTMDMKTLLHPAIGYARDGFPVSEIIAEQWRLAAPVLMACPDATRTFLKDGRAPHAGEMWANPHLAKTYRFIAEGGRQAFYESSIAQEICRCVQGVGGPLVPEDFHEHGSEWVKPLCTTYRGHEVYELPPNGQGATVLEMLNILEGYDVASMGHNSAELIHLLIEAKKIAFSDRDAYIADPAFYTSPVDMVSKDYAAMIRQEIDPQRARPSDSSTLGSSDTVYLSVVDKSGNAVSFINSIYEKFGSGLVAGDTGIVLQDRGALFSLDPGHPNRLEPRKRPLHTIIPAMVMKQGHPWFCFGVMGGHMQPQGHVQVLLNIVDFGMNVQEAGEAPRVCHTPDGAAVESGIRPDVVMRLIEKGHRVIHAVDVFGGYQGIMIDPETGTLAGGSDPRKDGCAIGY